MSEMHRLPRGSATLLKEHRAQSQRSRLDPIGVLLITLSAAGFGTLAIFGKLAYLQGLEPLTALSWRLGGATVALWFWLLIRRQWQVPNRAAIAAFALGAFGYALQSALFFKALSHASAGMTALMFFTYPAFVALLSWGISRKSLNLWQLQALGLALLGSLLTIDFESEMASPIGIVLGIASGAAYALYMVLSARLVRNIAPLPAAAWMLAGASLTIVGFTAMQSGLAMPLTSGAISAVAGLAIASTAVPIVGLFAGLRRLDVVPAAILSTLEPVLAVVMGIVLLGEHLWIGQLLGGGLIVASALMLQVKLSR